MTTLSHSELQRRSMPIIVGGFYRSGTTLVRRILDSHSRIHCGPEVKFFKDFFGDYPEDPLAHVRLFASARTYGMREGDLLDIFGRAYVDFHAQAARIAGKARWADKNPENVLYLEQWKALLPCGFLFMHVTRNPMDALASLVEIGFKKTIPSDFVSKIDLYRQFREAGDAYCSAFPETSLVIDYDELVTAPEAGVQRMLNFLGEAPEPGMIDALNDPARGMGIEDPKATRQATVHDRSIGRGARELSPDEQRLVRERLDPYLVPGA